MEQLDKNLSENWRKLSNHIEGLSVRENRAYNPINDLRRRTALQNLARRYRRFAIMGLCVIPASFSFLNHHTYSPTWGLWSFIVFNTVIIAASIFDWWLYNQISSISVTTMPVLNVVKKAWMCRKRHLQFIAIFLPIDLLFIGLLYAASDRNIYFTCGIITGFVLGLTIGLKNLFRFLADYKEVFNAND